MRRYFSQMNPTVRGLLIVALIAGLVIALNLYVALAALYAYRPIAFFIAIAFFVYLVWRERRRTSPPGRAGESRSTAAPS